MPGINRNAIIPPGPELRQPGVLGLEFERRDLLERVLLRVPFDADVVDGLLGKVLEQLRAEGVGYFVGHVEAAVLLRDDVDGVGVLDVVVGAVELFLSKWEYAVFGYVVAVAVRGLRVLGHGVHCSRQLVLLLACETTVYLLCCLGSPPPSVV
ncbi:hypothetical protein BU25DRAFT_106590 [Macroventuria anomochaeta]|uniref:Uncharacterized protein n=1 Tax=Macroventuria anomochaeta TaxID=301207 RepID=A0ACB6RX32_9PLEO|nr:uncharacterized protein BU25DRAFT_106590 [Macroventuria anomochaeta]KAF2625975.1 hypothetical protein BU25DRAFT_106590 [Macroventuria anomochaeta]